MERSAGSVLILLNHMSHSRAPRNRTIELSPPEEARLRAAVDSGSSPLAGLVCADAMVILSSMPAERFDLLFADPPYNLTKTFGKEKFTSRTSDEYEDWLDSWLKLCV